MYRNGFKRLFDLAVAIGALTLLLPVIIAVFLLLWLSGHKKPFFTQQRPGKDGKLFSIVKFRTMTDERDAEGNLLPDAQRLTPVGQFVRKTSLDEIPQLFNVLIGDMSLIGPRPLLVQYLPLYDDQQKRRHEVRPGITGWAQVNGRNAISWQQKFEYDVWYVDHLNLALDVKIFLLTLKKVFKSEGINAQGSATAEPFKGNEYESLRR